MKLHSNYTIYFTFCNKKMKHTLLAENERDAVKLFAAKIQGLTVLRAADSWNEEVDRLGEFDFAKFDLSN